MAGKPELATCPFCGSKMEWIDNRKDFTQERFLCGARCKNKHCVARVTFDCHNYSRSMFAKKFNRRVPIGAQQVDMWDLIHDFYEDEEETKQEENNDIGQSDELL